MSERYPLYNQHGILDLGACDESVFRSKACDCRVRENLDAEGNRWS